LDAGGSSVGLMKKIRSLSGLIPFALLGVLCALVLLPLLQRHHWPVTHENTRYPILLDHFREAFLHGHWYPRWLPRLNGGYGYPTFIFYQPGFFFFALPFALCSLDLLAVFKVVVWAMLVLGSSGVYVLGREVARPKVAFLCAVFFLLTPYLFLELYVRNDLSELLAMALCPWPLAFSCRLNRQLREGISGAVSLLGLTASTTALVLAHPAVALFAVPLWAAIACYISATGPAVTRNAVWLRLGIGFGAALVLSSPYWLTVLRMQTYVNMDGLVSGYYRASRHTVGWRQFFSNAWGFGNSGVQGVPISFQLGLPHALLAIVGLVAGWRSRAVRAGFVGYVLLILLMSNLAKAFWDLPVQSLRQVQFPWRLLSLTTTLQLLCAAGIGARDGRRSPMALLVLFLLPSLVWYSQQFFPRRAGIRLQADITQRRTFDLETWQWYADLDEFRPKTVRTKPLAPRQHNPLVVASTGAAIPLATSSDWHLRYRIDAPAPAVVTIHQSYFPGWRIHLDGEDVPREIIESALTEEGWMRVAMPTGVYTLDAVYDGPPGWRWQALLCALVLAGLGTLCFYDRRRLHGGRAALQ
jgi:hypothetical protein